MILELENWYLGYQQILTDCRPDGEGMTGSVLLLCSADVDAMAAARIWTYMLRSDGVSYQLLPCMSHSQLEQTLENKKADDVRAIVMMNLGASKNLTRLFEKDELALDVSVKIYVLDCRRPVHLANVHAGNNIVVFWDSVQNDDVPSDGDNLSGTESSSDEDDDDSDEDEDDSDDEGENEFDGNEDDEEVEFEVDEANPQDEMESTASRKGKDGAGDEDDDYDGEDESETNSPAKKRKTEAKEKDDDSSEDEDSDNESVKGKRDQTSSTAPSTQQQSLPALTPREIHHERRNRLRAYYSSGSFFGSPAAYVAFRVSTQMRFGDIGDLLWFACVGITDAYLHARLDVAGYTTLAMDLRSHCNRLFPNDMFQQIENTVYAEHLTGTASESGGALTKISFSENGRILSEPDFRFFLLRHTSLFDAMVYSDFISTRFQLSTSRGMHKLQELLAKMGYPLEECKQPFAFMKPKLRRRLQTQIRDHAEEYGLENFEFTSFFRVTGYQSLLSASDTSYAVTALLEYDRPVSGPKNQSAEEEELAESLQSFNLAFDALSKSEAAAVTLNGLSGEIGANLAGLVNGGNLSGATGLSAGIRLAMTMQRTIMATAASLIERNAITRLSHFRYAYLTCTSQSENQGPGGNSLVHVNNTANEEEKRHIFAKPLALTRLAHYLMDLHRENGKWTGNKARPLILIAEKPRTQTFLVVGYEYTESPSLFVKNRFGNNFELVAQSMQGTFKFDSFDKHVVEVNAADVQRFIEQLHYLMDSL